MYQKANLIAGGEIRRARFIKLSTAADFTALEADANERVHGIAFDAAQVAPTPSASDSAAQATDRFGYYSDGEECLLELGSGGATRGGQLKSDADGKGVASATTGTTVQWVGAEALESGVEGEKIRVKIVRYPYLPAVA